MAPTKSLSKRVPKRIARKKALPFEPLEPNAETVAAMREARKGKLPRVKDVDAFHEEPEGGRLNGHAIQARNERPSGAARYAGIRPPSPV